MYEISCFHSQVLIPKLKEPDPNPSVTINIMAAIGELAQVARDDMRYCVDELCPIIVEMLQDASSLAKREVALWTFGQLVESTGWVIRVVGRVSTRWVIRVVLDFKIVHFLVKPNPSPPYIHTQLRSGAILHLSQHSGHLVHLLEG